MRIVQVEYFFAGGCAHCAKAREALREASEVSPNVLWREVDIAREPARAADLGIVTTPALAIDGELVFNVAPTPEALRAAITTRLKSG